MKNTQNGSRHWISFGTVKRSVIRLGIAAMVTLSMAACMGPVCAPTDEEEARVVRVMVWDEILFDSIKSSGACTELVEAKGAVGYRWWETKMTGPVGSTCTVQLDLGSEIRTETTKLESGELSCHGYPFAERIVFAKE